MCGIAGILFKQEGAAKGQDQLSLLASRLAHRGPDGEGIARLPGRGFINRRLAIVDIIGGEQPIYNEDGSVGVVYNGEIYNYLDLRKQLEQRGHTFKTRSDTEVLVHLFEEWGESSFEKLRGMFAFALWTPDQVFLVRDQLGIKPLYIYEDHEKFIFTSEIMAVKSLAGVDWTLSPKGLAEYLTFRYTRAPYTVFARIRKLPAGGFLRIRDGRGEEHRYWQLTVRPRAWKENEAADELRERLRSSVSSQLIGEMPIGLLLSGGLDSSTIAYALNTLGVSVKSFNIGFRAVNEFAYSNVVAARFDLPHWLIVLKEDEMPGYVHRFIRAIDEPIADAACVALFRLCEEIKGHVTVILSGEGGDELFAGYPQYWKVAAHNHQANHEAFQSFLDESFYFRNGQEFMIRSEQIDLTGGEAFNQNSLLNGMLAYDLETWLPDDLMMKADKILMAHSLEGRFPFLDLDFVEFAFSLPIEFKLRNGNNGKWILRRALREVLPYECLTRPKMGFTVPIDQILARCKRSVQNTLAQTTELDGWVNRKKVINFVESYYRGEHKNHLQTWTIFVLYSWFLENHVGP